MAKTQIARLFQNGRSQAVRLPREFRFTGDRVRIRSVEGGVLLEPVITDPREWFAEMDRFGEEKILPEGREQPIAPERAIFK